MDKLIVVYNFPSEPERGTHVATFQTKDRTFVGMITVHKHGEVWQVSANVGAGRIVVGLEFPTFEQAAERARMDTYAFAVQLYHANNARQQGEQS